MLSLQRQRVISGSLIGRPSSRKNRCSWRILPAATYSCAERQVTLQNFERTRAKLNVAIFLRLGAVFIPPQDARLGDRQHGSTGIVIRHEQSDLLGGRRPVKNRNSS